MSNSSILLNFQESAVCSNDSVAGSMTKTGEREEADQDQSNGFFCGTKTATAIRESSDQDPSVVLSGTKTQTEAREETDQDQGSELLNVFPR